MRKLGDESVTEERTTAVLEKKVFAYLEKASS
jgi:hypothetical protein